MAGSYGHLLNGGWANIENMGDAHECVEELWWLVERAIGEVEANRLLDREFYEMKRGEREPDATLTDEDLLAMNKHLRKTGPANCWANASDEIARRLLIDLLRERAAKCTST